MEPILNKNYVLNLEDLSNNLRRYWRALRRELGDNELLREDFKRTIRYELVKNGFDDQLEDDEFIIGILNC